MDISLNMGVSEKCGNIRIAKRAIPTIIGIVFLLSAPTLAFADVVINEVMYDLEGSDAKREWVEIYNDGSKSVDLSDWRFNDSSNHLLNEPPENGGTGSLLLSAGEYAILASDADAFLSENNVSVSVIDTVISLGQQEENTYILSLIDADGSVHNQMSYTISLGADGDGDSLQLLNSQWLPASPTPGEKNEESSSSEQEEASEESPSSSSSSAPVFEPEKRISVRMEGNGDVIVGADALFEVQAFGFKGEPLDSATFLWNMGDGEVKKGNKVLHAFRHPGKYIVYVDAVNGKYSAHDRSTITAHPADISLSHGGVGADSFIAVSNDMNRELDLSGWHLRVGKGYFTLPERSFILPKTSVRYDFETTQLVPTDIRNAELLYPNGTLAVSAETVELETRTQSVSTAPGVRDGGSVRNIITASASVSYNNSSDAVKQEVEEDNRTFSPANLSSAAASGGESGGRGRENSLYPWVIGLGVIITAGAFGIYSLGDGSEKEELDLEKIVDEIEILEE